MKKFLTAIILCLVMLASSVTLFACKKSPKVEDVYTQMQELLTDFKQDDAEIKMFSSTSKTVNGVASNFVVDYYVSNTNYSFYNNCLVIPMNYIETYTKDLERIKLLDKINKNGKNKIKQLSSQISTLKVKFEDSASKYASLIQSEGVSEVVTEGYAIRFNKSMVDFIGTSYKIALSMAELKNQLFDDFHSLQNIDETITAEQALSLRDYFMLYIAYDYYKFFFENMRGEYFDLSSGNADVSEFGRVVNTYKTNFGNAFSLQAINLDNVADLTNASETQTNEQIKELFDKFDLLKNERKLLDTSLKNFNFYDFYVTYSCSLTSITNKIKYAQTYYNEINAYYVRYSVNYVNYLKNIFTKKV